MSRERNVKEKLRNYIREKPRRAHEELIMTLTSLFLS